MLRTTRVDKPQVIYNKMKEDVARWTPHFERAKLNNDQQTINKVGSNLNFLGKEIARIRKVINHKS